MPSTARTAVVACYNADPSGVLEYFPDHVLYDCSDQDSIATSIAARFPGVRRRPNTGHSLTVFMEYLAETWTDPAAITTLAKANLVGRHVSPEYLQRVHRNEHYTFLYQDASYTTVPGVSALAYESGFLERNDSWYVGSRPHRYFSRFDQVLDFLFVDPVHPEWIMFSPGGCYMVPRANIVKNPPGLYEALGYISSYQFFPAEAYFVERLLHTVFTANYRVQPYVLDLDLCREALDALPDRSREVAPRVSPRERLARRLWPR